MFGVKVFAIYTILIWSVITVILVESGRQKKDVHHMIILNQEVRPSKSHRHKNHLQQQGSSSKTRREPGGRNNNNKYHQYSSASLESFEDVSQDEDFFLQHNNKPKSKRHQQPKHKVHKHPKDHHHKNHHHHQFKHHHHNELNANSRPSVSSSNGKWVPMTSQELFWKNQPPALPEGAPHYSQPIPMEITTPFSLPPNSFLSLEGTLYPPLNSGFDLSPQGVAPHQLPEGDSYKPFDYSVLGQHQPQYELAGPSTTTALAVAMESKGKEGEKGQANQARKKNKDVRNRANSRFRVRRRNNNNNNY